MNPQLYDDCVHFCWKCKKVGMLLDIGDQWESTMTHKDCGGLIGKWRTVSKAKYVGWSWEEKEKFHHEVAQYIDNFEQERRERLLKERYHLLHCPKCISLKVTNISLVDRLLAFWYRDGSLREKTHRCKDCGYKW